MGGLHAALFDFGGVFTASPFVAVHALGAELGAEPGRLLEIVFGPYHEDSDHPWHRVERGELPLDVAREQILALGAEHGIPADPYQVFARMLNAPGAGLRTQVVERVRGLRRAGVATAIVTNNAREFRTGWRRLLPLDELFDAVVDSSEVGLRKPDPRIYRLALERLGDPPAERCVFLDDFEGNVVAARALGLHGILVGEDPEPALRELDALHARLGRAD